MISQELISTTENLKGAEQPLGPDTKAFKAVLYTPNALKFDPKFFSKLLTSSKYTTFILDASRLRSTTPELEKAILSEDASLERFANKFKDLNSE
jgi:hypothetical protein